MLEKVLPLDRPSEWIQLMLLRSGAVKYINIPADPSEISRALFFAKKENDAGWNVHFRTSTMSRVPEKRGHETTSSRIKSLWIDIDNNDQGSYEYLLQQGRPSLVVKTGGGYHGYWILEQPITISEIGLERIKYTLRGLAQEFGGDVAPANLAACLRLPDFINQKPSRGNMVSVVHEMDRLYSFGAFGYYTDLGSPPRRDWAHLKARADIELPPWARQFIAGRTPEGNRNRTAFTTGMWLAERGVEGWEELLRSGGLGCGLKEREIQSITDSVRRRVSRKV